MLIDAQQRAPIVARSFDVICAGEATVTVGADFSQTRLGGGAIRAAMSLARNDLHVGLATVLADDSVGRSINEKVAAAGIDVAGVTLSQPTSGLFCVTGGARQVVTLREEEAPVVIPEGWSSQVLLLSGMSPIVSHGGALCKAARAARRAGTSVVVDLHARWDLWRGRDWRSIRMILREADVVWSSGEDLLGLNMDVPSVRASMRPNTVFLLHGLGTTMAMGSFGEVTRKSKLGPTDDDDEFVSAICFELKHAKNPDVNNAALWDRALARGDAAAAARAKR